MSVLVLLHVQLVQFTRIPRHVRAVYWFGFRFSFIVSSLAHYTLYFPIVCRTEQQERQQQRQQQQEQEQ